jgi:hypothetical protein
MLQRCLPFALTSLLAFALLPACSFDPASSSGGGDGGAAADGGDGGSTPQGDLAGADLTFFPDLSAADFAGTVEVCNGIDDNGDGNIDEGFDNDEDGYTTCGTHNGPGGSWAAPQPFRVDCNDGNPDISPLAPEQCNGLDDDCDTEIDEIFDTDHDGWTSCGSRDGLGQPYHAPLASSVDCNDGEPTAHPGGTEVCDGFDNNCDGVIDEPFDVDHDTYTTCGDLTFVRTDGTPGGLDCDDSDSSIHPGAPEVCFDGKDSNCQGDLDHEDPACCSAVEGVAMTNASNLDTIDVEDFESFTAGTAFPTLGAGVQPTIPPANTGARGWERKDLNLDCADGTASGTGRDDWQAATSTLVDATVLGSVAAGSSGNNGTIACNPTGCFQDTALISPVVDFTGVTLAAGDRVLVRYRRFADHDPTGGTTPHATYQNVCDRFPDGSLPAAGAPYAPNASAAPGDERCDECADGEYFSLASWGLVNQGGTNQCFFDVTFPTASAAATPASHAACPLSARSDMLNAWRYVYADLSLMWSAGYAWLGTPGQRRFAWRLNTYDNAPTTSDANGPDDGIYVDDVAFFVCRKP